MLTIYSVRQTITNNCFSRIFKLTEGPTKTLFYNLGTFKQRERMLQTRMPTCTRTVHNVYEVINNLTFFSSLFVTIFCMSWINFRVTLELLSCAPVINYALFNDINFAAKIFIHTIMMLTK